MPSAKIQKWTKNESDAVELAFTEARGSAERFVANFNHLTDGRPRSPAELFFHLQLVSRNRSFSVDSVFLAELDALSGGGTSSPQRLALPETQSVAHDENARCEAKTRSNARCHLPREPGSKYCQQHNPVRAKERSARMSELGKKGRRSQIASAQATKVCSCCEKNGDANGKRLITNFDKSNFYLCRDCVVLALPLFDDGSQVITPAVLDDLVKKKVAEQVFKYGHRLWEILGLLNAHKRHEAKSVDDLIDLLEESVKEALKRVTTEQLSARDKWGYVK